MTPSDRAALAVALQDATPETLRRLGEERAAIADWMERSWRDRHARIPPDITAQVQDHRIMAALALAVATMQERSERLASEYGYNPSEVRWAVDSDGDTHWHDGHMYGETPRPLPAALAALLKGDQ